MEQITQGAAKKRILEILLDFSKYCDENKLQYYLIAVSYTHLTLPTILRV